MDVPSFLNGLFHSLIDNGTTEHGFELHAFKFTHRTTTSLPELALPKKSFGESMGSIFFPAFARFLLKKTDGDLSVNL